ncbi:MULTISPECIES: shikimate kinase [Nostocales]|jgi:shikimate kinase|uniref:Shikimate kinase n=1 Tax=Dolichospermum flos-aquae UHCC 0037 TaxID=2590026 RepID=A0ACC7S328_DOLFA|nr:MULTISPECIES: shikimate kinase [Nostocales]MBO1067388.1 shikimate kinase [Anabaena sp. 54]MTJ42657.1 shikimate kinase [Dolichospermum flos-aquae UHCC 0037]
MIDILKGVNLYLIGMMGVGKTTVGKLLAEEIGYRFVDTDEVIVKAAGKSINEIFAENGEAEFRQLEGDVLAQVCAYTKLVVATGGGIVIRQQNWSYLHHGLIIWLDAPIQIILQRLAADDTRPLLQDADMESKLRSLLEQRQPMYSQADLHITISATETPEEIATRILATIPSILKQQ